MMGKIIRDDVLCKKVHQRYCNITEVTARSSLLSRIPYHKFLKTKGTLNQWRETFPSFPSLWLNFNLLIVFFVRNIIMARTS